MEEKQKQGINRMWRSVLFALVACAMWVPTSAQAQSVTLGASVPVVVPTGFSTSVGVGVLPGIQYNLSPAWGVNLTSGVIYFDEESDHTEKQIPALVGLNYTLTRWSPGFRPYGTLKMGYTHALDSEKSPHWVTAVAGLGVAIQASSRFALDLGADLLVPDFRGNSDDPVGFLMKFGVVYQL